MLALDSGPAGQAWQTLAQSLPRPRAIIAVSAHWSAPITQIGSAARLSTIHDFYGFPAELFKISYEPPGAPELAQAAYELLQKSGWPAELNSKRGLDHGAWVPLSRMYPNADIPVLPVSISEQRAPDYHYRLGQALAPMLDEDVLLLATGSLTHNLGEIRWDADEHHAPQHVRDFQQWFYEKLQQDDIEALLNYRQLAPQALRAHPSDEHLLPLFVVLGAAGTHPTVNRHYAAITEGVLAMDIYSLANSNSQFSKS